jgi:competence protein ComEA
MPDVPRSHLFVYAVAAVAVLAFGLRSLTRAAPEPQPLGGEPLRVERGAGRQRGGGMVVHVAGAVRRPGVYRLRAGSRVNDAVQLAGGARRRADLTQVNLAQELEDGRQVVVPARPAAGGVPAAGGPPPTGPINLNAATLEQLDTIDGIGPATAQAILTYREEHGGFSDVAELDQVPGIGEVTLATLRDAVTL